MTRNALLTIDVLAFCHPQKTINDLSVDSVCIHILCSILPPGWKSASRAGLRLDSVRQCFNNGPPVILCHPPPPESNFEALPVRVQLKLGPENRFRPGCIIEQPKIVKYML